MSSAEYVRRVTGVLKISDGDSYWLYRDDGFYNTGLTHVRLWGYDTPELHSPKASAIEKDEARVAAAYAVRWFETYLADPEVTVWLRSVGRDPDSFGRWLCEIWWEAGEHKMFLGDQLRRLGLASVWPTRWRDEFDVPPAQ